VGFRYRYRKKRQQVYCPTSASSFVLHTSRSYRNIARNSRLCASAAVCLGTLVDDMLRLLEIRHHCDLDLGATRLSPIGLMAR